MLINLNSMLNRKKNKYQQLTRHLFEWILSKRNTGKVIGMIVSATLLGTLLGVIGSFVQAKFISPDDLGFIRKYSIIANYAVFLNLGLFTILQREYPVLLGEGKKEQAYQTNTIVQSWSILSVSVVCVVLVIIAFVELFQGGWKVSAALLIQAVTIGATVYSGFLACTYRFGREFERLAKGQALSSIASFAVIPFFLFWPFATFIVRSVMYPVVNAIYLHVFRPVKVGWRLPWKEFLGLVKRGMRLFLGSYFRYTFWLSVEIWFVLRFAGDVGVGLFVFSKMVAESICQLTTAVNQVTYPRLALLYGKNKSIVSCLKYAIKPTAINFGLSLFLAVCGWFIFPIVILLAFPKYADAIPLLRILLLQAPIWSFNIPINMVYILEDYQTQTIAAVLGLIVFACMAEMLNTIGFKGTSVAWSTIAGQVTYVAICLSRLIRKALFEVEHTSMSSEIE